MFTAELPSFVQLGLSFRGLRSEIKDLIVVQRSFFQRQKVPFCQCRFSRRHVGKTDVWREG